MPHSKNARPPDLEAMCSFYTEVMEVTVGPRPGFECPASEKIAA